MKLLVETSFPNLKTLDASEWHALMHLIFNMDSNNYFDFKSSGLSNGTFYRMVPKLVESGIVYRDGEYYRVNKNFAAWYRE